MGVCDTPIVLILLGGGGDALMASLVTVVPWWPGHALACCVHARAVLDSSVMLWLPIDVKVIGALRAQDYVLVTCTFVASLCLMIILHVFDYSKSFPLPFLPLCLWCVVNHSRGQRPGPEEFGCTIAPNSFEFQS